MIDYDFIKNKAKNNELYSQQNNNVPLNNIDFNLLRKKKSSNLFNRANTNKYQFKNPIKIQNNNPQRPKGDKSMNNYTFFHLNNKRKKATFISTSERPSTAPQKNKNGRNGNNNNTINNTSIKHDIFIGPNKRLPSPMLIKSKLMERVNNEKNRLNSPNDNPNYKFLLFSHKKKNL